MGGGWPGDAACSQPPRGAPGPLLPLPVSHRAGHPTRCADCGSRPRPIPGRWERAPAKQLSLSVPAVGPPLLIPMYFQYQIIMTMVVRKDWVVSQGAPLGRRCGNEDRGACTVSSHVSMGPQASPLGVPGHSQGGTCSEAARTWRPLHPTPKDPERTHTHGESTCETRPLQKPLRKFQKAT